jgi:hypothetical protein
MLLRMQLGIVWKRVPVEQLWRLIDEAFLLIGVIRMGGYWEEGWLYAGGEDVV